MLTCAAIIFTERVRAWISKNTGQEHIIRVFRDLHFSTFFYLFTYIEELTCISLFLWGERSVSTTLLFVFRLNSISLLLYIWNNAYRREARQVLQIIYFPYFLAHKLSLISKYIYWLEAKIRKICIKSWWPKKYYKELLVNMRNLCFKD